MAHSPTIIPYLSYADGVAGIEFLERAFGFRRNFAQMADDGTLLHAEMAFGDGVILVGTADLPKGSPGIYVVVEDVAAHHARAMEAGATLVFGPETTEWGTERYRVTDPEGHEWSFGTYAPSTEPPAWG
ncbi:VOC family protein [Hasllibacter sp. MH4015]|uniref:VOC family protein n=1 Tax=Hasllibacter sp. MH4015 TaxID=2854029 RepID=UPI001CD1CEDC|nr:VOC family protein [Hasllibacter sp. MH4015]